MCWFMLKRIGIALISIRRALRRPARLVPRRAMPPAIAAIPPKAGHRPILSSTPCHYNTATSRLLHH